MRDKKKEDSGRADELQFELKYCERCGGLWLRPVGGGQVYCVACAGQMAELPQASRELGRATMQQGPRWGVDHCDYDEDGDGVDELDLDAAVGHE
jgi:hypothetical protein